MPDYQNDHDLLIALHVKLDNLTQQLEAYVTRSNAALNDLGNRVNGLERWRVESTATKSANNRALHWLTVVIGIAAGFIGHLLGVFWK